MTDLEFETSSVWLWNPCCNHCFSRNWYPGRYAGPDLLTITPILEMRKLTPQDSFHLPVLCLGFLGVPSVIDRIKHWDLQVIPMMAEQEKGWDRDRFSLWELSWRENLDYFHLSSSVRWLGWSGHQMNDIGASMWPVTLERPFAWSVQISRHFHKRWQTPETGSTHSFAHSLTPLTQGRPSPGTAIRRAYWTDVE